MRPGLFLALTALLALASSSPRAQDFTIGSQNVLHFGRGTRLANQCTALTRLTNVADLILVQEDMVPNQQCTGLAPYPFPAGFVYVKYLPPGQTPPSHIEYFGFLYRQFPAGVQPGLTVLTSQWATPATSFRRPPLAALFEVRSGARVRRVWIVNVHACWNCGTAGRRAEAMALAAFGTQLRTDTQSYGGGPPLNGDTPVIFGGDWNITLNMGSAAHPYLNPGFTNFVNQNFQPAQPAQSTVTKLGRLVSNYDHLVYSIGPPGSTGVVTLTPFQYEPNPQTPANLSAWGTNVSDHITILSGVTLP